MTGLSYGVLVDRLFPRLTGGIRWGLDRTRRLLAAVGDPHRAYPVIHVGGTNGKGSVAAIVASVLRHGGLHAGLYTSPHLVDFRERIQLSGRPIPVDALLEAADRLWPRIEAEAPSFFEATTAIGFLALQQAAVDVAVVEVGMGGRLDATNVVEPEVVILTNVAMDHSEYLGGDLASIAREKAGIIKAGVPVVTGETDPSVLEVLEQRCAEVGAPLHRVAPPAPVVVGREGTGVELETRWGRLPLHVPLAGRHQATNLAVAVRALELLPDSLRPSPDALTAGAAATTWPGRLQVERIGAADWIFDVAHNSAGVESLLSALPDLAPTRPLVALVGVLGDKDWTRMLPPVFGYADRTILTVPPTAPPERRWDPGAVVSELGHPERVGVRSDFAEALHAAKGAAAGGTVLCTGSVHTVGDAMKALGITPFGPDPGLQPGVIGR